MRHLTTVVTGHTGNIFCGIFVPETQNCNVVSCAMDGAIRLTDVQRGLAHAVAKFDRRVHKLAFLPYSSTVFLSAGSDGTVRLFDLRIAARRTCSGSDCSNIVVDLRSPLKRESIDVNAISPHPLHGHLLAVGGGDPFVRVYDIRRPAQQFATNTLATQCVARLAPDHLAIPSRRPLMRREIHVTGLCFDIFGQRIAATYSGDDIFIFDATGLQDQSGTALSLNAPPALADYSHSVPEELAEVTTDETSTVSEEDQRRRRLAWLLGLSDERDPTLPPEHFSFHATAGSLQSPVMVTLSGHRNVETVKEVTFYGVDSEYVMSGSDCGSIFLWDSRTGALLKKLPRADSRTINCISANPTNATVIASCGIDSDIKIWSPDRRVVDGGQPPGVVATHEPGMRRTQLQRISYRELLPILWMQAGFNPSDEEVGSGSGSDQANEEFEEVATSDDNEEATDAMEQEEEEEAETETE
eukprot:TRINITY_DN16848_c0_g1_i2.p1 TRINITY_DN16848_c0_g1~~TRINITY_DN16848_c0_g1_i2.p1  ORF type:complete len:470 (+),score=69.40 TRINITY_DN16848_c0_g1_i2:320-1729(+)